MTFGGTAFCKVVTPFHLTQERVLLKPVSELGAKMKPVSKTCLKKTFLRGIHSIPGSFSALIIPPEKNIAKDICIFTKKYMDQRAGGGAQESRAVRNTGIRRSGGQGRSGSSAVCTSAVPKAW